MYKCYERYASCETANDCHQMTFLTTRSAARILIINLRHRQALLLTRPAVLLGEGRPDTRERRKSSLPWWLFVAGKDSSRLRLGPKYSTLHGFFARTELLVLAGIDSLALVSPKKRPRKNQVVLGRLSVVVQDFCSLPV